jgi:hypothetical protein
MWLLQPSSLYREVTCWVGSESTETNLQKIHPVMFAAWCNWEPRVQTLCIMRFLHPLPPYREMNCRAGSGNIESSRQVPQFSPNQCRTQCSVCSPHSEAFGGHPEAWTLAAPGDKDWGGAYGANGDCPSPQAMSFLKPAAPSSQRKEASIVKVAQKQTTDPSTRSSI